jgi:hypothetical protein
MILMGGSLALSCGGSVLAEGNATGAGGVSAMNSGGSSALGSGGSGAVGTGGSGAVGAAGSLSLAGGAGGASAPQVGSFECPPAQWNCSSVTYVCGVTFSFSGNSLPVGCVCDLTRPQSAADCSPNEAFVCLLGYDADSVLTSSPPPSTWDGATHVDCSCVPMSTPSTNENCSAACSAASLVAGNCWLPAESTCRSEIAGRVSVSPGSGCPRSILALRLHYS